LTCAEFCVSIPAKKEVARQKKKGSAAGTALTEVKPSSRKYITHRKSVK